MFIDGCKTIIVRCRSCGRLMEYDFNIFEVMSKGKVEYRCKCGEINVLINRKSNKGIGVVVGCFNCGDRHYHELELKEVIKNNNIIYCFHGNRLCFVGSKKIANQILLEKQVNIGNNTKEIHGEDYFNNFKVLKGALKKLYDLNKENKIDCDCGNSKINVELFCDRIELKCSNCNSVKLIFTETEEDLSVLLKKDRIILRERNISCIDSINEKNRDIKK